MHGRTVGRIVAIEPKILPALAMQELGRRHHAQRIVTEIGNASRFEQSKANEKDRYARPEADD